MYRFFVNSEQILENEVVLTGENYNHIANVLRMKANEKVQIVNKETNNVFLCVISKITSEKVVADIIEQTESSEPNVEVDIYQGITKADKFEYVIQKSVELGVNKVIPVKMKNCVSIIKDEGKKLERWNKISEAAAKQSKRDIIPKIEQALTIEQVCSKINDYDLFLVAYENEETTTIKDILKKESPKKIAVIIGPEGGFDKGEVEKLVKSNAKNISLGKRILRTETVAIVALSMIMYEYDL